MSIELIVSVTIGVWSAVVLLVVSLCRAAKRSDEAMDSALAGAMAAARGAGIVPSSSAEWSLRTLSLDDAAALLGVHPHTLLAWETRYGFPTSSPSEGHYNQSEVLALRDSLEDGVSIASAVIRARAQIKGRRAVTDSHLVDHRDGGLAS